MILILHDHTKQDLHKVQQNTTEKVTLQKLKAANYVCTLCKCNPKVYTLKNKIITNIRANSAYWNSEECPLRYYSACPETAVSQTSPTQTTGAAFYNSITAATSQRCQNGSTGKL
jgi:hypothetical protein